MHAPAAWKAWRRHLRTRKCTIEGTLPWAGQDACLIPAANGSLEQWLHDATGCTFTLDYALSALTWCRRLPELAETLSADPWWNLLDHLVLAATEADVVSPRNHCPGEDFLVRQLLAGELALTLACLFPETKLCRKLLPSARRVLSQGLADLLDGEGLLHAQYFDRLQPLLACWTRCRELGAGLNCGCWNGDAEKQFRKFVRNALRLARHDGTPVFSNPASDCGTAAPGCAELPRTAEGGCPTCAFLDGAKLLATAVALVGKEKDRSLAARRLIKGKGKHQGRGLALPSASVHSEWAAAAVMRPDWSRSSPQLTVLYPGTSCRVELTRGKDILCSGTWGLDLKIDGRPAAATTEWSELCWVSDKDVDYLELEIELGDGVRVQRHFLLARKDRFLLLADAVLASRRAGLEYRGTLPLRPKVTFREACDARQGTMIGPKSLTTALPLALPESLTSQTDGVLSTTGTSLELRQSAEAQSLFAPLFFDLDHRRLGKPATWRQLTVGESWTIQPNEVAVGYRVAIGRRQWLIYRSLARQGNRSLLGHNISSEMLVARFQRNGEVESLIEIE